MTLRQATLDPGRFERRPEEVLLKEDVLDRRLINVDGARLVRANEIELARVEGWWRVPHIQVSSAYLPLFVATAGTTITPYMQLYLQSAIVERGVRVQDVGKETREAITGAISRSPKLMGAHRNRGIADVLTAITVLFTGSLSVVLVVVTVLGR